MKCIGRVALLTALVMGYRVSAFAIGLRTSEEAQHHSEFLILSDDFGYGDAGIYGGGLGRGMPTPNLDRMAREG